MSKLSSNAASSELPRGRRLWLIRAILLGFGFSIIVVLELGLRAVGFAAPEPLLVRVQQGPLDVYTLNSKVGLRFFPPEMEKIMPKPGFQIFPANKSPQTRRVFVLGGSTTAGFPYHTHGSFPNFLRIQLEHLFPDTDLELINCGMTALNSYAVLDFVRELQDYQPDLFVIYAGHNEFYGALGPASSVAFGKNQSAIQVIRWILDLRISRAIARVGQKISGPPEPVRGKTLMGAMVGKTEIRLGDDIYRTTLNGFRQNLLATVEAADDIPVIFCEVVSNLRDQSPFASAFAPETSTATREEVQKALKSLEPLGSVGAAEVGDREAAIQERQASLAALAELDSSYAETRYALGRTLLEAGQASGRAELRSARDHDVIRFRAPSEVNRILRTVAEETGSILVPLEASFDRASPGGVPGHDLFHEHLHPNLNGTFGLAGNVARAIAATGFLGPRSGDGLLAVEQVVTAAGLTPLDHEIADQRIFHLTHRWPYPESDAPFRTRREPKVEQAARAFLADQLDLAAAHFKLGKWLLGEGRLEEGLAEIRCACLIFPVDPQRFALAGEVAHRLGRDDEARTYLQGAAALDPANESYGAALRSLTEK